jgi:iron complex outermembrane receptor protein
MKTKRARRSAASRWVIVFTILASILPTVASSGEIPDLAEMSLEDLMNLEVTSVSKREQPLSETAAAIYVITREDIRRSGVTSIPELLRGVPGLQVAQIDANKWAISSRGFLDRFANKMLVLIDGRSVYTPLFAGVYWDVQDTVIEDIDRIEVIRGPGATLWGANAVNGVINIATRKASETQGGLVTAVGGTHSTQAVLRYGGGGDSISWRAFGRFIDHSAFVAPSGADAQDEYSASRAGFRFDWDRDEFNTITWQGEVYGGDSEEETTLPLLTPPYAVQASGDIEVRGHHLLARWQHKTSKSEGFTLQTYYDFTDRDELRGRERRTTFDVDFQQHIDSGRHDLVWGAGFRLMSDDIMNTTMTSFMPTKRTDDVFSAFVQDDLAFNGGRLRLTLGSKFEHNNYSGFEFQPNLRLFRRVNDRHAFWAAVSRAVHSPPRAFHDAVAFITAFPDPTTSATTVVSFEGSRDYDAEDLLAFELGYRLVGSADVSVDVALFHNEYDNLTSIEAGIPRLETSPVPFVVLPQIFDNLTEGDSNGVELEAKWRPFQRWKLCLGYTWLDLDLTAKPASTDLNTSVEDGDSPEHQLQLRSFWDVGEDWTIDVSTYYVDDIPTVGIDDYTRVDLHVGWDPNPSLGVDFAVQNLLDPEHAEFSDFLIAPVLIERTATVRVRWRF